jgi:hypothetical protein
VRRETTEHHLNPFATSRRMSSRARSALLLAGILAPLAFLWGCSGIVSGQNTQPPPPQTYNISGTISPAAGGGGATVTLSGPANATTTANSSGNFTLTGLANGTYTVTPSHAGYTFNPSSLSVTVSGANIITGLNFTATAQTFNISGTISPPTGGSGAAVTLSGAAAATTTADGAGNYTFTGLPNGTYAVTPSRAGYTFNPNTQTATVSGANVTAVNFTATATAQTYNISGTISLTAGGSGSTVTLSGAASATTTTSSSGSYTFTGLANGIYTVTPSNPGYIFNPTSQNVTISGSNATGVNFTATAQTPSGPVNINGQNGTVVDGVHITNPNGDCLRITNSTNITVRRSEIGPCGGNGINISGGGTINVYDSYVHPGTPLSTSCCDTHDGIFAVGTSGLSIQGNVIAYGESNIEVNNVSNVSVIGNFLLNPIDSDPSQPASSQSRGQNFQVWSGSSNVTVQNNYALSSLDTTKYLFPENQEDSINFGITNGIVASGNYVTGGHSNSGCGIIADNSATSAQFRLNVLVDTGQCGISIADGTNQIVDGNKILNTTPINGGGNTAISVWKQYGSACGPVQVSNNIASAIGTSGTPNSYFNGGGCAPVTLTSNVFDGAAAALLEPVSTNLPPPLIPPQPHACVVVSPYTNNTSLPACSGSSSAPAPQLTVIVH